MPDAPITDQGIGAASGGPHATPDGPGVASGELAASSDAPTVSPDGLTTLEPGVEPELPAPDSEVPPSRGLSPRRVFTLIAVVLVVLLVGLIVYLLWFLGKPPTLTNVDPSVGIQPVWEVHGPGEGERTEFDRPMGVAVGSDDRIYVTDAGNNRVCVFDSQGRFLFEFGSFGVVKPGEGGEVSYVPGSLNYPVGIDVDAEGNVYVASFYNDSIEVFDAEGTQLRRFPDPYQIVGKGGSGAQGRGIAVTDVAIDGERLYATDAFQVLVFSLEGELLDQWGRPGAEPEGLDHPNGIAVGADGTVYVADSNHSRVTAFTPEGDVIWQVGEVSGGIEDTAERQIEVPRGLTVMDDGSVLVVDAFAFQLIRISADGEILERYGTRGVSPGQLNFPNDADTLRGFVVLADKENGRVQLVRLID